MARTVFLGLAVLVPAGTTWANEVAEEFFRRSAVSMIVVFLLFVVGHFVFVSIFARIFGLEGSFFSAILAVILGVVVGGVIVVATVMVMFFLPREMLQAIGAGGGVLGGAVGVKLLYKTDIGHGLLVYLLATTTVYILLMIGLVVAF